MASPLPFSEACERNKDPILAVLRTAFASCFTVLEVGSGTGQHAVHFAAALSHVTWQPSERAEHLAGLSARIRHAGIPNLRRAVELDVTQPDWPVSRTDAIFTANTLHIMSWPQVEAFFAGLQRTLKAGGTAGIYGPFNYDGRYTSPGNEQFDAWLRARDPDSGIRDQNDVSKLAARHDLKLRQDDALPANNRLLIFESAP